MKIELDFEHHIAVVTKEPEDPVFRNGGFAGNRAAEERFFYHVKQALQKMGHDVIKKHMGDDGHMVEHFQPYVRTRGWLTKKRNRDNEFAIWWGSYAICDAAKDFNENGSVTLILEHD
jgi:hypothetical protein